MGAIIMRLDFGTFAFGYKVKVGGGTPNWATALGQGKAHKINDNPEIDKILKGMIYTSVSAEKISTKIGKGGNLVSGKDDNSPIVIGSVFEKIFINEKQIFGTKFILLVTRDTSASHEGRLRLKYGPSNTYTDGSNVYTNQNFLTSVKEKLGLVEDACWFVSEISIENQDELKIKAIIVNKDGPVEYSDSAALHSAWEELDPADIEISNESELDAKGTNKLFYGVPGSGKSHSVDQICSDKTRMERVVFHPEYTYSDFVGQIMPQVAEDGKTIEYKFIEGPFTRILQTAYKEENRNTMFYLVIEEINRGNAPAIFGDIFQLLDRDDTGASKYGIKNVDIAEKVFGKDHKLDDVKIPSNVTILATMNTSDQNVFTLDTAFQRRWEMTQVTNQFKSDHEFADRHISDTSVTWKEFNETVNDRIVRKNPMASTEDKRLGTYFIKAQDLEVGSKNFPEKVIKYLWDDAVKFSRDIIFNDKAYPTLEMVIEKFEQSSMDERLKVFTEGLFKAHKENPVVQTNDTEDAELEEEDNNN